jgi:hypothetical protein
MPDTGNCSRTGSSSSEDHEDILISQIMGFLKEDDEVAAQADLTNQSVQAAAAIAQRTTDGMHYRNACMREIVKNLQKS